MKKSTFIHLIFGTIGGLLFALGMCMCLLPEWNAFSTGVVCTAIGALSLLIQSIVAWLRSGRKIKIRWKTVGKILFGIFGALVLGIGMCMILVWELMLPGIMVGIVGIVLLLIVLLLCAYGYTYGDSMVASLEANRKAGNLEHEVAELREQLNRMEYALAEIRKDVAVGPISRR